tara:strand:+ start:96 stop:383 length:288 start_codon:yes stop_codon:yes gene_type:complete
MTDVTEGLAEIAVKVAEMNDVMNVAVMTDAMTDVVTTAETAEAMTDVEDAMTDMTCVQRCADPTTTDSMTDTNDAKQRSSSAQCKSQSNGYCRWL